MDDISIGVGCVLLHRGDDLHRLLDGFDMDLRDLMSEIMDRGIDSMLTDLELEEGLR